MSAGERFFNLVYELIFIYERLATEKKQHFTKNLLKH